MPTFIKVRDDATPLGSPESPKLITLVAQKTLQKLRILCEDEGYFMSSDLTFITNEKNQTPLDRFRVLIKDIRFLI
ncbi:hypothetical protein A2661_00790 [Candidatus Giovannonibacteria bacterium RIFCSPHIGHO2_01_FULL_45_24]|uniref:Uncharacterized protein n=1 Tax=Candidatus Giovannonibacteria bacterium RIFCSPLOWO2_01_FULL_46_32 TaxID=1798353 RepID=A0A1F5XFA4_9BACT|nr:MAG: hypothetical protein A2661_00790 [Candidatus Giovannonibacteria bacterium RIFCSPHIGHO2_01_FULL_45_24]OGF86624.1 MAG: hypothetical protein A3B19_00245 [Candidatus Giovannonibacteria bacterium RIFCSPLOWO2_01_FULL_46_32]